MQKTNKKIAVLGCGWLGFPLAKHLVKLNLEVNGSTTSVEKMLALNEANINAYLIDLTTEKTIGEVELFLENTDLIVINIPPKLRNTSTETVANSFVKKMECLIPHIEKAQIKKVVFVSSTSVYGEDDLLVTEKTIPKPETESGKQLFLVENLLFANTNFETVVLRFGGLIGENRKTWEMLAGKTNIEKPNGLINLIHQQDCIEIISQIIQSEDTEILQKIYNGVSNEHPKRKDFYTQKSIENNLPLPKFNLHDLNIGKTVISENLKEFLNYTEFKKL
jgi:nucleoside-diphosphate-sugar epimerase